MRRIGSLVVAGGLALGIFSPSHQATGAVLCRKKSGAVVVRDEACKRKETSLDLAEFGAVGPTGPAGEPGARGPSNAFSGSLAGPVTITTASTPGDPVGHLDLPAGKYVIFAKGWLENDSASITTTAICTLAAESDSDSVILKIEPTGNNAFRETFALNVTHEFTTAGTVQLSCATGTGVTITANDAVVTAIEVGTLSSGGLTPG